MGGDLSAGGILVLTSTAAMWRVRGGEKLLLDFIEQMVPSLGLGMHMYNTGTTEHLR